MKTAIVVGHDLEEQGALSPILNMTEFNFNSLVAEELKNDFDTYFRNEKLNGYTSKMKDLAKQIKESGKDYDFIIELHFNMFDGKANKKGHGAECVIFPENQESKNISKKFLDNVCNEFPVDNRGVKEHGDGDRGYQFLKLMPSNAIIVEPFFGDEKEAKYFSDVKCYAEIIKKIFK